MNKPSTEMQEILYYSKGNEVMITGSDFKVKNIHYQLTGITGHSLSIISPARESYVVLMVMGIIIFFCGTFNILSSINFLAMALGIVFLAWGLLGVIRAKEKYAVKIVTAAGEKNVVVSQDHEYVSQIVSALNRANFDMKIANAKR
jgi:hypothetical protein